MVWNGRGTWKLRAMPSRVRWYGGRPVICLPLKIIWPASLRQQPEMQLMSVGLARAVRADQAEALAGGDL